MCYVTSGQLQKGTSYMRIPYIAPVAAVLVGGAITAYGIYASNGNNVLWLIGLGIGVGAAVDMVRAINNTKL